MHELRGAAEPTLKLLLGRLQACDLVLIEGFKGGRYPKLEVWRAELGKPPLRPGCPASRRSPAMRRRRGQTCPPSGPRSLGSTCPISHRSRRSFWHGRRPVDKPAIRCPRRPRTSAGPGKPRLLRPDGLQNLGESGAGLLDPLGLDGGHRRRVVRWQGRPPRRA